MMRRVLLALPALFLAGGALAQAYPNKPVRLIVPAPPGGGSGDMARAISNPLSARLERPVVIDNRGGAGGTVGADMGAKAALDGNTQVLGSVATHAIAQALYPKLPYDPLKDFVAVAPIGGMPHVLVVHPTLGVNSAQELIATAKTKPGALSDASAGNGPVGHLAVELFKSMAGIDIQHIPYKGSGPALSDLAGGQVKIMLDTLPTGLPTGLPLVKSGQVKALAEVGVPGFEVQGWYGVFAHAGTPAAIVQQLNAAVMAVTALPEVRQHLSQGGAEPTSATPEAYASLVRTDAAKLGKVVRDPRAKIE